MLTRTTRYLVIGVYATGSWAHPSFGRKIEKAVDMRAAGIRSPSSAKATGCVRSGTDPGFLDLTGSSLDACARFGALLSHRTMNLRKESGLTLSRWIDLPNGHGPLSRMLHGGMALLHHMSRGPGRHLRSLAAE